MWPDHLFIYSIHCTLEIYVHLGSCDQTTYLYVHCTLQLYVCIIRIMWPDHLFMYTVHYSYTLRIMWLDPLFMYTVHYSYTLRITVQCTHYKKSFATWLNTKGSEFVYYYCEVLKINHVFKKKIVYITSRKKGMVY